MVMIAIKLGYILEHNLSNCYEYCISGDNMSALSAGVSIGQGCSKAHQPLWAARSCDLGMKYGVGEWKTASRFCHDIPPRSGIIISRIILRTSWLHKQAGFRAHKIVSSNIFLISLIIYIKEINLIYIYKS
ncbi:uncharacterized protein BP01DRAFT_406408 [Aspergillus saccharolyticus JOP 1030-1]|uniref:Uncharacterized protein n=1 Tax=Aspergillus saccharolyticus JOP 1030-1 TaxID=1450539 RepID=A0A318Z3M1_9EURO|nr:hypothetical protein BP01DRAFT_406408 [Aspergillus saccharolyticus JOP 1030-1]PYH41885.1 hypothetical protein BP01DRAFT_406408 [Aspergillus saccharolyticus JOP 1030-1]